MGHPPWPPRCISRKRVQSTAINMGCTPSGSLSCRASTSAPKTVFEACHMGLLHVRITHCVTVTQQQLWHSFSVSDSNTMYHCRQLQRREEGSRCTSILRLPGVPAATVFISCHNPSAALLTFFLNYHVLQTFDITDILQSIHILHCVSVLHA